MVIIDYKKKYHKQIIHSCVEALKKGKVVAYPTDTCYGLAVDAENITAVKKLYKVKGRSFKKPIHIIPPTLSYAKKTVAWNKIAYKLAGKFWPGPLTIILDLRFKDLRFNNLSAGTGSLGIRWPKNRIALDLARVLKRPITTTSANFSGGLECYSAAEIIKQFRSKKHKPDVIINSGKLSKKKHSTLIKINQDQSIKVLRSGPVSETKIRKILNFKF